MLTLSFTPFPILITERLTLRQLSINDDEKIFALRSNKEVNKYIGRVLSNTVEDARKFIYTIAKVIAQNEGIYWAITLTNNDILVGTICLFNFSNENDQAEIGYELLPAFQRQGIMQEALEEVIDYAFQTLKLQKIIAFTHNRNHNSTKLLTKFNFLQSKEADKESPDFNIFTLTHSH